MSGYPAEFGARSSTRWGRVVASRVERTISTSATRRYTTGADKTASIAVFATGSMAPVQIDKRTGILFQPGALADQNVIAIPSKVVYDHRGFGTSDGGPEVDAAIRIHDWRDAISFVVHQPEADTGAGVGIWGSTFAGGLALLLAAIDSRVSRVVAQMRNVSGRRNGRELFDENQRADLRRCFAEDRATRLAGAEPAIIPVFNASSAEAWALPPAVSPQYIEAVTRAFPPWSNQVTLRSVENMLTFEPAAWLPFVSPPPLVMIVAMHDICTVPHLQLEVFAQASEPKRLISHPGGHVDTYGEHFGLTNAAAIDWYAEHLTVAVSA